MLLWERIYGFISEYFRFREGKLAIKRPSYCLPGLGTESGRVKARAQPGIFWGSMVAVHGGTEGCVGCGVWGLDNRYPDQGMGLLGMGWRRCMRD